MFAAACDHSDPYPVQGYGLSQPFVPGAEARLAKGGVAESWSQDGRGISYTTDSCFTRQLADTQLFLVPFSRNISALELLPATGGQISWERCEGYQSYRFPIDSVPVFTTIAFGDGARALYQEVVIPRSRHLGTTLFPYLQSNAALYVSDSSAPFTRRQYLLKLYRDSLGTPVVPRTTINWLNELSWVGPNHFLALGMNMPPAYPDSVLLRLGVVSGTITSAGATLQPISGAERAGTYSVAEGGATLVFNRDSTLRLERVPIGGGASEAPILIPAATGRLIIDLSCELDNCLVLTQEPAQNSSTLWNVFLTTGAVMQLRRFSGIVSRARLSPISNAVLIKLPTGLYLYTDLLPQ